MATGDRFFGPDPVPHFNGGLFDDDDALPLEKTEIETVLHAARLNWSDVDPSILGTLFERGLDPNKRSQLGAHYTDREKIMLIVEPVVVQPLEREWSEVKNKIAAKLEQEKKQKRVAALRRRREAERLLYGFLERLRKFTVLDPACGSGNFLFLALKALKDLEHRVQLEAEALDRGLQRSLPRVGPANVKGIEINPYAAELARVSVWIGEIQWMRRNGFSGTREPILDPLETIECRDALFTPDSEEADWPEADVVIGNPPFVGGKKLRRELGDPYVDRMFSVYEGRVPQEADLVCYWFDKAMQVMAKGSAARVGLVATNSIRGGANRRLVGNLLRDRSPAMRIFDAWSDEPWVVDGAAVRVSLICFSRADDAFARVTRLDAEVMDEVFTDLTGRRADKGSDLTEARPLGANANVAFMGDTKGGAFDVAGDKAREWLTLPANPNGRPNADVLKPWLNAMDLTRRPKGKWIVDFGWTMSEEEAALYEAPFQHAREKVRSKRQENKRESYRVYWWRHMEPRQGMWRALEGLNRYIATPRVAKHRLFVWLDSRICPDSAAIAIARDDGTTFGILHSRFHEAWSLRLGTSLGKGNDPRYTPTTTFATFPFPVGLSPDIPAERFAENPHAIAIAEATRRLVALRNRWLNPPEWVDWVDEPVPAIRNAPSLRATPPRPHSRRAHSPTCTTTALNGSPTHTPHSTRQSLPPTAGPRTSRKTTPSPTSAVPQTSAQCELSLCVCGIRRSARGFEQVQERSSREQVELQEAEDLAHGPGHLVGELQVGEQEMHAHRDPDLRHHGVARGADEALDAQVLLDPLEEGLDLPTLLVDGRDGLRSEPEVVGEERVELLGVGVAIADSTQRNRTPGAAFDAGQLDGLVRGHARPRCERPPLSNRVLDLALQPSDQENSLCIKGFQPLEVEV